ncbi:3 hydroxyacyl CoA dehydrogenase C terminal domain [Trypanosoma vivax]|nr:3 hydroxyacyl CoA dehydrogenase C terminal domain [Trypanosoma vivax]
MRRHYAALRPLSTVAVTGPYKSSCYCQSELPCEGKRRFGVSPVLLSATQTSPAEISQLVREIEDLRKRCKYKESRPRVLASNLSRAPMPVATQIASTSSPAGSETPLTCKVMSQVTSPLNDPPVFSDIACTLQELEQTLFQLSAEEGATPSEQAYGELSPKDSGFITSNTGDAASPRDSNGPDGSRTALEPTPTPHPLLGPNTSNNDPQEMLLRCWDDADADETCAGADGAGDNALRVSFISDRIVALELHEQPISVGAAVATLSAALSSLESSGMWRAGLSVILRTLPGMSFYTPLSSEAELTPIARMELAHAKQRLLQRMQEACTRGVVFTAELCGPAFDFGAELLLMCGGGVTLKSNAHEPRFGFPSICIGVWPSPCVLPSLRDGLSSIGNAASEAALLHTLDWESLRKRHPKLMQAPVPCSSLPVTANLKRVVGAMRQLFMRFWCSTLARGLSGLGPTTTDTASNVLMKFWIQYYETVMHGSRKQVGASAVSECWALYMLLLNRTESRNVKALIRATQRMRRRVLKPPPRRDWAELTREDAPNGMEDGLFWVIPGDMASAAVRFVAERYACSDRSVFRSGLLIGDGEVVRDLSELLHCAVVATPVVPFVSQRVGGQYIVEVSVHCSPDTLATQAKVSLSTALSYLQSKEIPYIVTKRGGVSDRLVVAFAMELFQLAAETDPRKIESVACERLGFRMSPFEFIDRYSISRVVRVMQQHKHLMSQRREAQATGRAVFSAMAVEGIESFYSADGRLNRIRARNLLGIEEGLSEKEVLLRLLAALLDESCRLLLDGDVETAEDINLASLYALSLCFSTGGILSRAEDIISIPLLLRDFKHMSTRFGRFPAEVSPLLTTMVEAGESFRTLSEETLWRTRRIGGAVVG